jgi:hypothetical protein
MTQTTLSPTDLQFTGMLLTHLEADLRYAAEVFDHSFWPPKPLSSEDEALLSELIAQGSSAGFGTAGMVEICRRFGFDPES